MRFLLGPASSVMTASRRSLRDDAAQGIHVRFGIMRYRIVGQFRFASALELGFAFNESVQDMRAWTIKGRRASIDEKIHRVGATTRKELTEELEVSFKTMARRAVAGQVVVVFGRERRFLQMRATGRGRFEAEWLHGSPESHAAIPVVLVPKGRVRVVAHLHFRTAVGVARALDKFTVDLRLQDPWLAVGGLTVADWQVRATTAILDLDCPGPMSGRWDHLFGPFYRLTMKADGGHIDIASNGQDKFQRLIAGKRGHPPSSSILAQGFGRSPDHARQLKTSVAPIPIRRRAASRPQDERGVEQTRSHPPVRT